MWFWFLEENAMCIARFLFELGHSPPKIPELRKSLIGSIMPLKSSEF